MTTLLTKEKTRMRVKEHKLPVSSTILGKGLDVTELPEGHLCCGKCSGYKFECWMYGDNRRIEMGCMDCGESTRLYFPMDIKLDDYAGSSKESYKFFGSEGSLGRSDALGQGRFQCLRHPTKGMVLVHNVDVVSIGCESCFTELNICLRKAKGVVLVDG